MPFIPGMITLANIDSIFGIHGVLFKETIKSSGDCHTITWQLQNRKSHITHTYHVSFTFKSTTIFLYWHRTRFFTQYGATPAMSKHRKWPYFVTIFLVLPFLISWYVFVHGPSLKLLDEPITLHTTSQMWDSPSYCDNTSLSKQRP